MIGVDLISTAPSAGRKPAKWRARKTEAELLTRTRRPIGAPGAIDAGAAPAAAPAGAGVKRFAARIMPAGPNAQLSAHYSRTGMPRVAVKGSSWLGTPASCLRYRPATRQPQEPDLGRNRIGFRTVRRAAG
jgi:hypothetical protein